MTNIIALRAGAALLAGFVSVGAGAQAPKPADVQAAIDQAYTKYQSLQEGKNADYIPALAKVDSKIFGLALVTTDGKIYTKGDIASEVSIQSISKVFTMAKVIEEQSPKAIEDNMGVDATGQVFNSIVAIEQNKGSEMNAMVNTGAINATRRSAGSCTRMATSRTTRIRRPTSTPSSARSA